MMTPGTKALDKAGIAYRVVSYDHHPDAASYGQEAVDVLGLDPASVFKTLLAKLDNGDLVVAIVPVGGQLSLKALARAAGAKKATMAEVANAERITGYVAGGISPFGQRKQLRTFVDESCVALPEMFVSGGKRGLEVVLDPADLVALLNATTAPIAQLS